LTVIMTYMRRDHISKVPRRYSEAFNRRAVAEVESGQYTALQAAATHVVNFASVYKWLRDFLMLGLGVLAAVPTVGALV
jgi:transposase-like protein